MGLEAREEQARSPARTRLLTSPHGKEPARSLQRRRARHHHHDHGAGIESAARRPISPRLKPLLPVFLSYVLSFIYVGIYWNNHHHMFHAHPARQRRHPVGEPASAVLAVAVSVRDGVDGREPLRADAHGGLRLRAADGGHRLLHSATAPSSPSRAATRCCAAAIGRDWKGKLSPVLYLVAIPLAFVSPWIASGLYMFVALLWLVPDRRIERVLEKREQ